jgi:translation initiation factor 2-alpha kinase 4
MQKLTHPNVVSYFGLSMEHHSSLTIVRLFEEFVHGSNFAHFLSENLSVDLSALRHYVGSILEALAFMHQHNFVHRDIRETSIYLESSGRVRLGDFSIDKRIRDLASDPKEGDEKYPIAIGRYVLLIFYSNCSSL